MQRFDFIVIGGGMMGAPCARYLAEAGHTVALVAAPEPGGGATGPFGSHYDAGRITRHVAHDPDWARLSAASIARYRDIEARSGEAIFSEVGGAMAGLRTGPLAGFTAQVLAVADGIGTAEVTDDPKATGWHLPDGSVTVWEQTGGGWIDPRAMVRGQIALARGAGARVFEQAAVGRDGGDIALEDGSRLSGGHVVVATGPHVASDGLLPLRPAIKVWARTIAFIEVTAQEAHRLRDLPTLIWTPGEAWDYELYALPPIRYPDGRWYIKVGGQKDGPLIGSASDMRDWFHCNGDADVAATLLRELRRVLPPLEELGTTNAPCAVVWTDTGKPYIDSAGPEVTILAGGNGAAAKCGDELGRLGALCATGTDIKDQGYISDFAAVWA